MFSEPVSLLPRTRESRGVLLFMPVTGCFYFQKEIKGAMLWLSKLNHCLQHQILIQAAV